MQLPAWGWVSLCWLLLAAILWLAYSAAFDAPFYFDTVVHLLDRTNLQIVSLSPQALWDSMLGDFGGVINRPLSRLSLAITHFLFGLSPRAYRAGNVLIHSFSALALFFMLISVIKAPRVQRTSPFLNSIAVWIAACTTLLWAVHPVHTNVVTYVVQRMAGLCGAFTFLCVGCYLRARLSIGARRVIWTLVAVTAALMAISSKESGLLAFPLVFLAEVVLLDRPVDFPSRQFAWSLLGATGLGIVALLVWRPPALAGYLSWENYSFDVRERLWTEARLQFDYLRVLVAPVPGNLRFVYEPVVSKGWFVPPSTFAAILMLSSSVGYAIWCFKERPLLSYGILWFVTCQGMEGTIFPLELYYEHRMYLASATLVLGVVALLWEACSKLRIRRGTAWSLTVVALLATGEVWATMERNRTWADPLVFWLDALQKQPNSARILSYLGQELTQRGRYSEAEESYRKAMELDPGQSHLFDMGLARVAYAQGRRTDAREFLLRSWNKVQQTNGGTARQIGMLALQDKDLPEATRYLDLALEQSPGDGESWRLVGVTRMLLGDVPGAISAAEKAVRFRPGHPEAWNTLGAIEFRAGNYKKAEVCFGRAVELDPNNKDYTDNLARAVVAREGGGSE